MALTLQEQSGTWKQHEQHVDEAPPIALDCARQLISQWSGPLSAINILIWPCL